MNASIERENMISEEKRASINEVFNKHNCNLISDEEWYEWCASDFTISDIQVLVGARVLGENLC